MASRPSESDEFFVGYGPIPPKVGRFLLKLVPLLVIGYLFFALIAPSLHFDQFNPGKFAKSRDFEGLLRADPTPHLLVPRPENLDEASAYSVSLSRKSLRQEYSSPLFIS